MIVFFVNILSIKQYTETLNIFYMVVECFVYVSKYC